MYKNIVYAGFTALMLFLASGLMAQTTKAVYGYDANGNRVSTMVVPFSLQNAPAQPLDDSVIIDPENSLAVKLFPNPTKGDIRIDIESITPDQLNDPQNALRVWDMQGKLLWESLKVATTNTVDLADYPNGIYIVQLTLCGSTKSYKIIKY